MFKRVQWVRSFGAALSALILFCAASICSAEPQISVLELPPLTIGGRPAKAHTQGLEVLSGRFYVTARREDIRPPRALLLTTAPSANHWSSWDITPDAPGLSSLDHPGGMQSDGEHLWIPLAESKRHGQSVVRRFLLADLADSPARKTLKSDLEFFVPDHIGALAVSTDQKQILGANWDTETVYLWDYTGNLLRTLRGSDLRSRGLGFVAAADGREERTGLAVQDWKWVRGRLFASGLFKGAGPAPGTTRSRLIAFTSFLEPDFHSVSMNLPQRNGVEMAREAMALAEGQVYFLPADLSATNALFRISLPFIPDR